MSIILLISFLWSYLEGKREAQYFHYKWSLPNPTKIKDEHPYFTLQRGLYVITSSLLCGFVFDWWIGILTFISISLSFSFFHNGSYYLRRNQMNNEIYPLKWKDESTTTTAKISLNYKKRLILLIVGIIISITTDLFSMLYIFI